MGKKITVPSEAPERALRGATGATYSVAIASGSEQASRMRKRKKTESPSQERADRSQAGHLASCQSNPQPRLSLGVNQKSDVTWVGQLITTSHGFREGIVCIVTELTQASS
jgi:hypothetical protein